MPECCQQPLRLMTMDMICKFNKSKPVNFERGSDILVYEEWLCKLQNTFEIVECPKFLRYI